MNDGIDARDEFLNMKRLAQVIVRTCLQAVHTFIPRVTSGEDNDRYGIIRGAPVFQYFQTTASWNTQIKHNNVI